MKGGFSAVHCVQDSESDDGGGAGGLEEGAAPERFGKRFGCGIGWGRVWGIGLFCYITERLVVRGGLRGLRWVVGEVEGAEGVCGGGGEQFEGGRVWRRGESSRESSKIGFLQDVEALALNKLLCRAPVSIIGGGGGSVEG